MDTARAPPAQPHGLRARPHDFHPTWIGSARSSSIGRTARMLQLAACSPKHGSKELAMADYQPPETRKTEEPVRNRDEERDSTKSPEPVEDIKAEAEEDDRFQATDN